MAKNLNLVITRLLDISNNVINGIEMLSALSFNDEEDSEDFDYCLNEIKKYLTTEAIILNNLNELELHYLIKMLPKYNNNTLVFDRTYGIIEDRISELPDNIEFEENEEYEMETTDSSEFDVEDYFIDDDIDSKEEQAFLNSISIIVLKSLAERIKSIPTENKNDYLYKQNLLRNLKIFKYLIFSQNNQLEKLGVDYRFNVANIPYINIPNIESNTIAYNHCVSILDKLYDPPKTDNNFDDTSIQLFNMMSLEIYLNYLSTEELIKLKELCDELKKHSDNPFLGDIAHQKILLKNKN